MKAEMTGTSARTSTHSAGRSRRDLRNGMLTKMVLPGLAGTQTGTPPPPAASRG